MIFITYRYIELIAWWVPVYTFHRPRNLLFEAYTLKPYRELEISRCLETGKFIFISISFNWNYIPPLRILMRSFTWTSLLIIKMSIWCPFVLCKHSFSWINKEALDVPFSKSIVSWKAHRGATIEVGIIKKSSPSTSSQLHNLMNICMTVSREGFWLVPGVNVFPKGCRRGRSQSHSVGLAVEGIYFCLV